jgi:hypothetical protein
MFSRFILIVSLCLLISGCATGFVRQLSDPTGVHNDEAQSQIPVEDYAAALVRAHNMDKQRSEKAEPYTTDDQKIITDYIDKGIGVVDAYCLRWFEKLNGLERLGTYQIKDFNVIASLGTTVLGLAKASHDFVTGTGAAVSAINASFNNYRDSFLVAPSSKKVQDQVLTLMQQQADELRAKSQQMKFVFAYEALEQYANQCRYVAVKDLIDKTLSAVTTEPAAVPAGADTPNFRYNVVPKD